jgi:TRAP-type uncharacterized transport system substrate-binding protein
MGAKQETSSGEKTQQRPSQSKQKRVGPGAMRPRLMFHVASELVASSAWPYRATYLEFRSEQNELGSFRIYCSPNPASIQQVIERKIDISILNPEVLMKMAHLGIGPFDRPHPLATITVMPHYDQLGFAVTEKSGITSLEQIREERLPLRLLTRGSVDLATGMLVNEVLKAHGFSFSDIRAWGGRVFYDQPLPKANLERALMNAEFDAIFDEAVSVWANVASETGMRFLSIGEERLTQLEALGFKRGAIERSLYPGLPADVTTVDFSGWPIFTHVEAPDLLVTNFCAALEDRKHLIEWQMGAPVQQPLPLQRMCTDSKDTPLDVPLHPAAERFWREMGYLS